MAPHMCLQRVAAGMGHTLPRTSDPLASVLLLPVLDVLVVYMLNQAIHVAHVTRLAAFPGAYGNLLLELVIVGPRVYWRAGHAARRV